MVKKYRWSYPEETIEKAKNFYDEGHSYPWIANQLGMPRWMTVYDWKKKFNWDNKQFKKETVMRKGASLATIKVWNELPENQAYTSKDILNKIDGIYERKDISSVLCRFVKIGCAVKGSSNNLFIKIKNYYKFKAIKSKEEPPTKTIEAQSVESVLVPKPIEEDSISLLTLGKAWDALTDDLKVQVIELRKQLSEERKTVGELVEQKRELEELYKKAQTRILELNTGGKGKSISLSALQNFRDELPK